MRDISETWHFPLLRHLHICLFPAICSAWLEGLGVRKDMHWAALSLYFTSL